MLKRLTNKYSYTVLNIVFSSLAIAITILMFGCLYAGKVSSVNDMPQIIAACTLLMIMELISIYTLVKAFLNKDNNICIAAMLSIISIIVLVALCI